MVEDRRSLDVAYVVAYVVARRLFGAESIMSTYMGLAGGLLRI